MTGINVKNYQICYRCGVINDFIIRSLKPLGPFNRFGYFRLVYVYSIFRFCRLSLFRGKRRKVGYTVRSARPYYVSFSLANEERINFLASSALFPRSLHNNFALITRNKPDRNAEHEICLSLDSSTIATRYW